ncbi:MAG: glycosylase [Christensenellaceae bacterium]|jgi:maltose alpha-D-glucosyltransferase/alpha-amylase|nr:glycosylase [Christensenellaceae bacterium]
MKYDWLESAVFYQIYPTSFYDSNGDGIGDIRGIIEKLPYIKGLGINAIWLNPCFRSAFGDGGYDIVDYYTVDEHFGTNEDLIELFDTAKRLGIAILLDLVMGHTSIEHPAFKASQTDDKNEFSDMYIWRPGEEPFNNSDGRFLSGIAERPDMFMINYYAIQPAINYGFYKPRFAWQDKVDAPAPTKNISRLIDVCVFWLNRGATGFRVDMAGQMVKGDYKERGNIAFWNKVIPEIKAVFPDAIFVSEWFRPERSVVASSFDIDFFSEYFIYQVGSKKGPEFANKTCYLGEESGHFKLALSRMLYTRKKVSRSGYYAVALGNHDKIRMSLGRDSDISKVTFAFHLLMPHVPFIYYGDEIGIPYTKLKSKHGGYRRTGSRTPMQWSTEKNRGFSTADEIYLPVSDTPGISVLEQESQDNSLLETVRALIHLKRTYKCFRIDSALKVLSTKNGGNPFIFKRVSDCDEAIVIICPRAEANKISLKCVKQIDEYQLLSSNFEIIDNTHAQTTGKAFAVFYKKTERVH